MKIEIYISSDGATYKKLDLIKDESIILKLTQKDTTDLSKVFAPYSQNFVFEATPRNTAVLEFFGYTKVQKTITDNKFKTKIYENGILTLQGLISISSLSYKNGQPENYTANFVTSLVSLKDKIGDDLIQNLLGTYKAEIVWQPNNIKSLLVSTSNMVVNGISIDYSVPFISNERVWSYSDDIDVLDNIKYNSATNPLSNNIVYSDELRPVISMLSIIEAIKKKYELSISMPLSTRNELKDAFVWCNSEFLKKKDFSKVDIQNAFSIVISETYLKYIPVANLTNDTIKITRDSGIVNPTLFLRQGFNLENVVAVGTSPKLNIRLIRTSNGQVLQSKTVDIVNGYNNFEIDLDDNQFISNELEYYIEMLFDQPTSYSNMNIGVNYVLYNFGGGFNNYESNPNNNSLTIGADKIDLFKSLPPTKVIDFLTSFFKTYNISIFDSEPNNDNLYFLTPEDINTSGLVYSKKEVDYTPYTAGVESKSTSADYNYYNLKHVTSKYKSNVDFLAQFGLEYGQAVYPLIKPAKPIEFKIETSFSIIPPVLIKGTSIKTAYGFTSDTPTQLETGETRYKPNYNELTVFYKSGNYTMLNVGYRNVNSIGQFINSWLNNVLLFLPWTSNNKSFAFSVLTDNAIDYTDTLYSRYYQTQIARLLDVNALSQTFTFELPADELYLNESVTAQGSGLTPSGFRLQNEVIVGEDKFTILTADIDITTGKVKATLLNY